MANRLAEGAIWQLLTGGIEELLAGAAELGEAQPQFFREDVLGYREVENRGSRLVLRFLSQFLLGILTGGAESTHGEPVDSLPPFLTWSGDCEVDEQLLLAKFLSIPIHGAGGLDFCACGGLTGTEVDFDL